ncbi:MAG: DUF3014 domain-containing protein [Methylococcales bacterium]
MKETKTSLSLPKKSKTGFSPIILVGIPLLATILLLGIYFYPYEAPGPKSKTEQRVASGRIDLPGRKPDESSPPSTEAVQNEKSATQPEPEAPGDMPEETEPIDVNPQLPLLAESDAFAQGQLASLSDTREYGRWIGVKHLIPIIAMVTDNISRGAIPTAPIRHLTPKGKFSVLEESPDRYLMDPKTYHRYNICADTLESIDLPAALRIFRILQPLFDSAYQELGYPEGDFEPVLRKAIKHLLAAPVLSGEVALVHPSVMYRFADPKIESLSRAQKQLIRMGPRNTRIIQSVLRGFLTHLDQSAPQPLRNEVPEE